MYKYFLDVTSLILAAAAMLSAQPQPAPRFEVASVKRSAPGTETVTRGGPGTSEPERITYRNFVLRPVIMAAYGMPAIGPDWLDSDRFDILANVPPGTSKEDAMLMMRNLLAARFELVAHTEPKPFPSYDMVVTKITPGLVEWKEGPKDPALPVLTPQESGALHRDENGVTHMPSGRSGMAYGFSPTTAAGHLEAVQVSMEKFANWVSGRVGAPVLDRTGLMGKYSFIIDFKSMGSTVGPSGDADAAEPVADILTVLRLQLGLKLEKKETPRNVLVIDRIQRRPTEN